MATREHHDIDPKQLAAFLEALRRSGYRGEIATDLATRTVFSTDSSIYQLAPAAVLYPREGEDLNRIVKLASSVEHGPIPLSPRGGGTGTNGQSLTSGVVVDTSRYLNRILSFDHDKGLVIVGPGVVLDQLNAFLKPFGLWFPPTVSTASRATIGGMVATDASGKGSRIYGKTSDYIHALDVVLSNGENWTVEPMDSAAIRGVVARDDLVGRIHQEVHRVVTERRASINAAFPNMNRGLTGYNLKHVLGEDSLFRLSYLLAGSEGTLALTKSITVRVVPRPAHRALVAVRYADFSAALVDVQRLLGAEPAAIEILDDKVLGLAQQDIIWSSIEGVLGGEARAPIRGLNFVEVVGRTSSAVEARIKRLTAILDDGTNRALDWTVVRDPAMIAQLWALREKAVGLLGRLGGGKQGTAFVEDTAVPPEHLADYVAEFRALLDRYKLSYGMFGHADVGCLHVRPALDMRDPADAALIRPISDEVARLTRKYGGLLWGEHGRGFRGQYSPFFFGAELYGELCRIKAAFDAQNIFNPGKLAVPHPRHKIDRIDAVPMRGSFDGAIEPRHARDYDRAIACNGNGACHSWDASDPMCPSFKATGDRTQSPKGRAALLREWARLTSSLYPQNGILYALEDQLKASLSTCLSCKACASQCPVKVDIPTMKARFLQHYHRRQPRPLRDYVVARMETVLPLAARAPRLANAILQNRLASRIAARVFKLVDLPRLSTRPRGKAGPVVKFGSGDLAGLSDAERSRSVILAEDSFTSYFDVAAPDAAHDLLTEVGFKVHRTGPRANGKALQVLGMLDRFGPVAAAARQFQAELAATRLPIVGIESVAGLMHEHEYRDAAKFEAGNPAPGVLPIESFLAGKLEGQQKPAKGSSEPTYLLFLHCTEKSARPQTGELWTSIFQAFGLRIEVQATGCCGMAGLFGHQREHVGLSKQLFDMSWRSRMAEVDPNLVLATGFSCRCQTRRFAGFRPRHPAEALVEHLRTRPRALAPNASAPRPSADSDLRLDHPAFRPTASTFGHQEIAQ